MDILIVDDVISCRMMSQFLRNMDLGIHTVRTASTRINAISLLREKSPDIVILDIEFQNKTEWHMIELLKKQIPNKKFVPFIVQTKMDTDVQLAECLNKGADDFLLKPINRVLVEAKIRAWSRIQTQLEGSN